MRRRRPDSDPGTLHRPVEERYTLDWGVPESRRLLDVLLGRGPETARLEDLISDAAGGRGGALVIEGEPGVGKTALLEDAAQHAPRFSVLRVAGVESELALPYAALHQLCARMIARRDRLPSPRPMRSRWRSAGSPAGRLIGSSSVSVPLAYCQISPENGLSCVSSMMRSGSTRSPSRHLHLSRGARRQILSRLSSQPAPPWTRSPGFREL